MLSFIYPALPDPIKRKKKSLPKDRTPSYKQTVTVMLMKPPSITSDVPSLHHQ